MKGKQFNCWPHYVDTKSCDESSEGITRRRLTDAVGFVPVNEKFVMSWRDSIVESGRQLRNYERRDEADSQHFNYKVIVEELKSGVAVSCELIRLAAIRQIGSRRAIKLRHRKMRARRGRISKSRARSAPINWSPEHSKQEQYKQRVVEEKGARLISVKLGAVLVKALRREALGSWRALCTYLSSLRSPIAASLEAAHFLRECGWARFSTIPNFSSLHETRG